MQHRGAGLLRKGDDREQKRYISNGGATARQNGNVFGFSLHRQDPLSTRAATRANIFLENLTHLITQGVDFDPISEAGFFQNY
ncbi:hypothetical protein [Agrobacterium arsenijevicii]|uniref:hypothetical protein n=1 Tax=Agrobacterium arsenijevicii TaxID=1585697 RepID=UPI0033062F94